MHAAGQSRARHGAVHAGSIETAAAPSRPAGSSGAPGVIDNVAKAGPLERDAQRPRREVVDVDEIVGERRRDSRGTQASAPLLLPQLRLARRAPSPPSSRRSKQRRNAREHRTRIGNVLEHIGQRDRVERRRARIDVVHVQLPDGAPVSAARHTRRSAD